MEVGESGVNLPSQVRGPDNPKMLERLTSDPSGWALFLGFWVLLFALAGAELWRPLHAGRDEPAGRIPGNVAMGLINAALSALLPLSTVFSAEYAARAGIGLMNLAPPPAVVAIVATVAMRSLATYAIHRLSHRLPVLWRVHRVHHSDTALDLSTGFRNHPLELAFVVPWLAAATVAFGLDAPTLLAYEAAALGFALWDHANLRLPLWFDRALRLLFVTPAMHHVHHSALRGETDSNYGDMLSIWDRLFGTYRVLEGEALDSIRIGLGPDFDPNASNLVRQLRLPLEGDSAASRSKA
jgi:sterol desaturase/sphingolipid hydroxylase (fatty acid hydroxylase superfamily)